jgi:hypothetical protein
MAIKPRKISSSKKLKRLATRTKRPVKTKNGAELLSERTVGEAFARIDEIRKSLKPLPKGMTIKDLIEEGRR